MPEIVPPVTNLDRLSKDIDRLRDQLNCAFQQYGIADRHLLAISRRLDRAVVAYQRATRYVSRM